MRRLLPIRWALLAAAIAAGASLGSFDLHATDAPATQASGADDVGILPCLPGIIRPKTAGTPVPGVRPSKLLEEQEKEVAATRVRADAFQRATDEAVREAWRREREAVRAKFVARAKPIQERERIARAAAIDEFKAFVAARGNSKEAGEATYRLAELQFETASDAYAIAHQKWEAETENAAVNALAPGPEPRPDYLDAVATYRTLVARFDGYGKRDGALYMIAFCLGEMRDAKGARDSFEELASSAPKSEYAPEAWLRVGEYHFDRGELWAAIDAYGHATGSADSPYYDKALYKLAWSWYRLADAKHPAAWEESARTFGRLLDAAPSSTLRSEALQYLARIYADHGGPPEVRRAIAGRAWAQDVFPALAQVWFEEGTWTDSAEAFRLALENAPDADGAPVWAHRRGLCLARSGKPAEAAAAREELHRHYGTGSAWAAARATKPALLASTAALAEPALLQAAVFAHQRAQDSGAESEYQRAGVLYGEYLARYPGRPAAYDIAFYRAECLYYARHFAEAADAYGEVLLFSTDDRWHAEAAFSRVKAREKLLGALPVIGDDPALVEAAKPLAPEARAYAAAAEDFTCVAPTDWRVPEALYRASQVYYGARRLVAARSRAEAVVGAAPQEDLGAFAATLVVDAWRLEGNWSKVESAAARFAAIDLGRTPLIRESTKTSLHRVALEAGYRVAEEFEAHGQRADAAAKFLALAGANPKSEIAPRALFSAADLFEKLGAGAKAGELFQRVSKSYPTSPLAATALFRNARVHERILLLPKAAEAFTEYARKLPQGADSAAATWNAAVIFEAGARWSDAAAAWDRYAESHPKGDDAAEARMRGAECWTRAGKSDRSLRAWRALVASTAFEGPRNVLALAGLSRAERAARLPSDSDARRALEAQALLLKRGESTPESARASARAGLAKAADLSKSFDAVTITLPESKMRSALRVKHDLLASLEDTLLAAAASGDPDAATEALDRIGEAYAAYARAVLEAPVPPGPKRSRDAWREKAIQTAEPLQEKAAAAFRHNLELAARAGVVTPWTRRSEAGLATLDPEHVRPPREDARPLPPSDVWALPSMLAPPGVRVADAGPAIPSTSGTALAREIESWQAARGAGDRSQLVAAEQRIAAVVTRIAAEPASELTSIAWLDLGVAREAIDDHAGANVAFEAALNAGHDLAPAAAGEVAALARKGNADTAILAANEWLSRHPQDAAVRANLAGAQHLRGNAALALDTAIDALGFDSNLGAARRGVVEYALASGRPELAVFAAREGVAFAPADPRAIECLGLALRRSGDERVYGRAAGREVLVAGAAKFPADARLGHAAGVALLEDGDAKHALALLEKAAPHAADPGAWTALAAARRENGDAAPAAQAADAALAMRPDDPDALRNRGLAAADAGDFTAAESAFTRYLAKTQGTRGTDDPVAAWLADSIARRKAREGAP